MTSSASSSQPQRVCECCGRDSEVGQDGWIVNRKGNDFCPECAESLATELQRMIAKLPRRIGLCPVCAPEFYYPLAEGEGLSCPSRGCSLEMIVYERATDDHSATSLSASSSPVSHAQPTTSPATSQCPHPYHAPTPSPAQ